MIKIINIMLRDTVLSCPFVPQNRDIDPVTATALISAGANLINGFASSSAQEQANNTNRAIAKENRDWQTEENQKARDFSLLMYEKQNAWLSPKNQRSLLEQGGYNPYLYGNNYSATGGSVSSPTMSSAPSTPHISPVNPLQGLNEGFSNFAQLFNIRNQSLQVESNIDLQKMKSLETIADIGAKVFDKLGRKGYNQFMEFYAPQLQKLNWQGSPAERLLNARMLSSESTAQLDSLRQQIEERFGYQRAERELQILQQQPDFIAAQIAKLQTGAKLDTAYAYRVGSEVARNMAQAGFFNAQANQLTSLLPYLVTQFQLQLGNLGIDFSRNLADFNFEEFWRDYQNSDFGKFNKAAANAVDKENSPVVGFVKGVLDNSPLGKASKAVRVPYRPQSGLNGSYQAPWQNNPTFNP